MVLVRRIRRRGANMVVEAHGEVLFSATGDVGIWTNRFSHRVRAFAIEEAPTNKRPRWNHYGKPLKTTFTVSTTYQPTRMKVYSAIGSTAPYAAYVDQGTGIHAGRASYPAKVLPPWQRGSPSLYEATWRPGGPPNARVTPVMIRGQKGQFFFAEGLKRGYRSMRMRSYQVPEDARITDALRTIPHGLANFVGNTPSDSAFRASLAEWREWRDETFNMGRIIGRDPTRTTEQQRRWDKARNRPPRRYQRRSAQAEARRKAMAAERARRWREEQRKKKGLDKPAPNKKALALKAEGERFYKAMDAKYESADRGTLRLVNGRWQIEVVYRTTDDQGRTVFAFKIVRGKSTVE